MEPYTHLWVEQTRCGFWGRPENPELQMGRLPSSWIIVGDEDFFNIDYPFGVWYYKKHRRLLLDAANAGANQAFVSKLQNMARWKIKSVVYGQ